MCGVFAQFERSMIVSRVNAGLKRARVNGKTLSRPKIAASTEASIRKALAKGDSRSSSPGGCAENSQRHRRTRSGKRS